MGAAIGQVLPLAVAVAASTPRSWSCSTCSSQRSWSVTRSWASPP